MAIFFHCPWPNAEQWLTCLRDQMPGEDWRMLPDLGPVDDIDIAMIWAVDGKILASLPKLRLILSLGAGIDQFTKDPNFPKHLPVARLVDPLMARRMAEYVTGQVLRQHLHFTQYTVQAENQEWRRSPCHDAGNRTVGILGLGQLGAACAQTLTAVGFNVVGWSRGPREIENVTCHYGADGLATVVRQSHHLVCLLPLTAATENLLDGKLFAALPEGAHVINCARGRHIDEAALLQALDDGHLAAASLDVFREEPLAREHVFWHHPKITVTPHVSSLSEPVSGAVILAAQAAAVRAGEPVDHLVNLQLGY